MFPKHFSCFKYLENVLRALKRDKSLGIRFYFSNNYETNEIGGK